MIACPACGESTDLVGSGPRATPEVTCGACGHRWRRQVAPTCRLCGSDDLTRTQVTAVEAAGRGEQRTPMALREAYDCRACGGRDVTSRSPRPASEAAAGPARLAARPSSEPPPAAAPPMPEIRLERRLPVDAATTFELLATSDGLRAFLDPATTTDGDRFAWSVEHAPARGRVRSARPGELLVWEIVEGPAGWQRTGVAWQLEERETGCHLTFRHAGWRVPQAVAGSAVTYWNLVLDRLRTAAFRRA